MRGIYRHIWVNLCAALRLERGPFNRFSEEFHLDRLNYVFNAKFTVVFRHIFDKTTENKDEGKRDSLTIKRLSIFIILPYKDVTLNQGDPWYS